MVDANGTADFAGADWHGEQLERAKALFESVETGGGSADLRARILGQAPSPGEFLAGGVAAFRDLLRIEGRPSRFQRLLRSWIGKVTSAIRTDDFAAAGRWMEALKIDPIYPSEFSDRVTSSIAELSRPEVLDDLVVRLAKAGDPPEANALLEAWGRPLVAYLVYGMVVDDPPVNRRHLVGYLAIAGRDDVALLTERLSDARWFIVRNVAIAVGMTGRKQAIPSLEMVLGHEDDRVRVEVVRSLAQLDASTAIDRLMTAMADSSPRVRQAAVSLLRASPSGEVIPGIIEIIERGAVGNDDARRLVSVIAERKGEDASDALAQLAARRFGAGRTVRDAARAALDRRGAAA